MTCLIAAVLAATWVAVVVLVERAVCGTGTCTRAAEAEPWWSPR